MQALRYRREIIPNRNHLHSEQVLQKGTLLPKRTTEKAYEAESFMLYSFLSRV